MRKGLWRPGELSRSELVAPRRVEASPAQRAKVAGLGCAVCERRPVDPAHLVPQRLGGCAHRDCVIGLCRTHHRLFDCARLRLDPFLGPEFALELAHALTHVDEVQLQHALVGGGWPAPWQLEPEPEGGWK